MSDRPIRRVGIVVHAGRPAAVEAAREITKWLDDRGVATRAIRGEDVAAAETRDEGPFPHDLDLVISVGGDGTLLRAAEFAHRADAPLLGVKVGRLGFLTEVEPEETSTLLDLALQGKTRIEERMAIVASAAEADDSATGRGAPPAGWMPEPQWALNEVIVEKRARHRLVTLASWVDGERVTTFSADGVIVATPTGSTAYSFSARGPIVYPRLECIVLTPVSPHMVFDRAIVLAPEQEVVLEVLGEEPAILSADGRPGVEVPVGARVRIRRADHPARLVRMDGDTHFFSLLREKFSLPEAMGEATRRDVGPGR
jgi:NAD+ kinase